MFLPPKTHEFREKQAVVLGQAREEPKLVMSEAIVPVKSCTRCTYMM